MSWRTVVITKSAKLDYHMGFMVVRQEEIVKIHLSEISLLLIESTAVSFSCGLITKLLEEKIAVVFCDEKRNPLAEVVPYYGAHDSSGKIKDQVEWDKSVKNMLWTSIVLEKLNRQKIFLQRIKKLDQARMIEKYMANMEPGDPTNREGIGAKVYFHTLFGKEFSRSASNSINACLNYGYAVLHSFISREIVSAGYLTQIGIGHKNSFNHFNLSSDLMEPFRPLVDEIVYLLQPQKIDREEKRAIIEILNRQVFIVGQKQILGNALKIYVKSALDALSSKKPENIKFCSW